jgi:hypothetical protein
MSVSRTAAQFGMTLALAMVVGLTVAGSALSQPYAQMAPLSRYLIADRKAEVELARSAAPPAISLQATVLVLTPHGYETAVQGTNGFTCVVERSWDSPFDAADFWNWKLRAPVCYNPAASRAVLRYTMFRAEMVLRGFSKARMLELLQAAVENHQLPGAEPGSMAYMMSKEQYLGEAAKMWYPHLMFYAPKANSANAGESWGANLRGSPVIFDSSDHVVPEPWTIFFVPVAHWSDRSAAPAT